MNYPSPFEQLRGLAVAARRRGEPFEEFWDEAVRPRRGQKTISWRVAEELRPPRCVVWPSDTEIRNADRVAVVTQREGWRRAYEREEQTAGEEAVVVLGSVLDSALVEFDRGLVAVEGCGEDFGVALPFAA